MPSTCGTTRPCRCSAARTRPACAAQNERLVLSLVRRHGPLAKSEIARMTGLSAQTVSVIMRHLESDRLLRRGEPQRGRVGPAVGADVARSGRRLLPRRQGRAAQPRLRAGRLRRRHPAPEPRDLPLPHAARRRRADPGRGRAERGAARASMPGASPGSGSPCRSGSGTGRRRSARRRTELAAWRSADIRAELADQLPWPVYVQNDATAACGAELAFGGQRRAAGLHLLLRRRFRRRRAGAERRALRRAHRQRRGDRLHAGARTGPAARRS